MLRAIGRIILFLVCCQGISAQSISFTLPHTQYTVANGLPQMQVRCFFVDEDGLVWLGTQGGLAVFDGNEVHTVQDTGLLAEGYIQSICRGSKGLLVSMLSGNYVFDGNQLAPIDLGDNQGISYVLFEDRAGRIWFMNQDDIELWILEKGRVQRASEVFPDLAPYNPHMAWGDRTWSTLLLIDNRNRLISLNLEDGRIAVDSVSFSPDERLGVSKLNGTSPDDLVLLQFGTERLSLNPVWMIYRWTGGHMRKVAVMDEAAGMLRALTPEAPLGYFGFREGKSRLFILRDGYYHPDTISAFNAIRFLFEAHQKLYVGSDEGFIVLHGDGLEDVRFPACDYAWSVTPGRDEEVYLACYKTGIFHVDKSGHTLRQYTFPGLTSLDGLGNQVLSNTLQTADRKLWGSTSGFLALKAKDASLSYVFTAQSAESFALDPLDGSVMVGTKNILLFNHDLSPKGDTLRLSKGIIAGGYVNDLAVTDQRELWVAAPGGIEKINLADRTSTTYTNARGNLPCRGAVTLDIDERGNIWSGGTCGLMVLRPGASRFDQVLGDIISQRVNQVQLLPGNRLACASNNNLYLLDIEHEPAILGIFNEKNGLNLYEPSENGSCLTDGRYVWLPSVAGIQRLDLGRFSPGFGPASLHVIRVNDMPVPFLAAHDADLPVKGPAALLELMLADHSGRSWKFQFRIGNRAYSPWQSTSELLVSGLQHGPNRISLRAAWNPNDPTTFVEKTIRIDAILPLLSRRNVQVALGTLSLLLAAFVLLAVRAARRNARRAEMLNADLYKNRLQTIQAYFNPHFLFNTLSSIQDKVLSQDARAGNDMIIRLSRVFRKILEAGKRSDGRSALIPLTEELSVIEDMVFLNNMQVAVPVDFQADVADVLRKENPLIPPMLIQPFVENAFKHAFPPDKQDKQVRLRCYQENSDLVFEVRDNGVGLSGKGVGSGTSMGLALARERMKILNDLKIENALDIRPAKPSGTLVEIRLKRNP